MVRMRSRQEERNMDNNTASGCHSKDLGISAEILCTATTWRIDLM